MTALPVITRLVRAERPADAPEALDVEVQADNGQHWILRLSEDARRALAEALGGDD